MEETVKILVLNCGSSSVKYQVIRIDDQTLIAKGMVEKIGMDDAIFSYQNLMQADSEKFKTITPIQDHEKAIEKIFNQLISKTEGSEKGILKSLEEIDAVGHRVVHGGEKFAGAELITQDVIDALVECMELAPLHNFPNIQGIKITQKILPNTPQTGIFDTAFHQTMPEHAYLYGIPYEYYKKHKIRRYGFHGTSHLYVSQRAAEKLGKPYEETKTITCHLGNGASVAAIKNGKSIDTSMGFTPLEGLIMGTRSGDIDPAIIPFLSKKEGLNSEEVGDILNKKSGMLGLSEISNDMRDIEDNYKKGNKACKTALECFAYRVKKYIGAYFAALNGADCIVFTGGIGERSPILRNMILSDMQAFGIEIDKKANDKNGEVLSTGKTPVYIIPTNEELQIAILTQEILENKK